MRTRRVIRRTSQEAYEEIKRTGRLGAMQFQVYEFLFRKGPSTAGEVNAGLAFQGQVSASFHKRLSELERMGVVDREDVRPCRVTGRNAITWKTTNRLPSKALIEPNTNRLTIHERREIAFYLGAWLPEEEISLDDNDMQRIRELIQKVTPDKV